MARQIILDTETTGLSPEQGHRLIEVGCLEMIDRRLTGNHLHFYLNPKRSIDPGAQAIHGISIEFLTDKPLFSEVADELIAYLKFAELIIHNAPFDLKFLNAEFKSAKKAFAIMDHCTVIDTLALARRKHPGKPNDLNSLCKRYHINNAHRTLHGALLDSQLLAEVYLAMTGGQEELFVGDKIAPSAIRSDKKVHDPVLLTVIKANNDEREAHEKFLKMLKKKGNCAWEQGEAEGNDEGT